MAHPMTKQMDIDSPETISVHRKIILSKPVLGAIYDKWYSELIPSVKATEKIRGPMIEIGCGASLLEEFVPGIIKTDVVPHIHVDKVVDGNFLPFADGSLRAIFVVNALHHFERPADFLAEAQRCLIPGGRLTLIEPTNSPLHRFMIRVCHPSEYFDSEVATWENSPQGRLSKANNALPWIIFERDRQKFDATFPNLKIRSLHKHTYLIYYASGGLSYRSFLPPVLLPLLRLVEGAAEMMIPSWGTEMTIEIEKV
jgi:SAM-dependent methyltransferase